AVQEVPAKPARLEREPSPPPRQAEDVRRCPGCGRAVHVTANRCGECGTRLMSLKPGFATPPPVEQPEEEWQPDLRRREPTPQGMYVGLILGLLALLFGVLSFVPGVCVLGFICGVIGWILNAEDLRHVRRRELSRELRAYARYGLFCSIGGLI